MLVAGFDSSTQSCKLVIRDAVTGELIRQGRASHAPGTEVDPENWWAAVQDATAAAGGLEDVAALSVAGQQHGMVALDADGHVVRDALLWNDTRSAAAARDLIAEFGQETLVERTGLVPVASFTITKLRWLRDAEPQNAARVAAVALPHDWLTWRLRGYGPAGESELGPVLSELVTDRSDASGTGYFDSSRNEYDRELLGIALRRDAADVILPRVLEPAESVIDNSGRRVAPGAGDNAGAALGMGAIAGDIGVSIGTSGTVFAVATDPVRDTSGTVAGFADAAGGYLPIVTVLNAARVLDQVAALLGVDHAELSRLALAADPGSAGLVLQPWFEGERTPNQPDATATLFGMTLASTTRENLARAAIEGVLCSLAEGLDAMRALGVDAKRVLLTGGAAQSPAVQQIAGEVFGVPVVIPDPGEYVALGAATQATFSLTGERPAWSPRILAELEPGTTPARTAYRARL